MSTEQYKVIATPSGLSINAVITKNQQNIMLTFTAYPGWFNVVLPPENAKELAAALIDLSEKIKG